MKCNGVDLYESYGIVVNKYSPDDCIPKNKTQKVIFPNIDGSVYKVNDTFEPYTLQIDCTIISKMTYDKLSEFKKLILNKNLELEVETRPGCILKARLLSKIDFRIIIEGFYEFTLLFEVQPFVELLSGREWKTVTNEETITNLGNYPSNPLIKVSGLGNVSIKINDEQMDFSNVSETFIIDMDMEDVYGLTGNNLNNYMNIESDFLKFPLGEFKLSYTGATKVEIMPRWRLL